MSIPLSKPKEGVIHLGPKSPRSRIQTNYENNASYTLSNTSQMEQINLNCPNILGESKRPNEHLEVVNKQ